MRLLLLCLLSGLMAPSVFSAVINIPGDQAITQAGIDYATEEDTVLIAPGVDSGYGNYDIIIDKGIHLIGEAGPILTLLNVSVIPSLLDRF